MVLFSCHRRLCCSYVGLHVLPHLLHVAEMGTRCSSGLSGALQLVLHHFRSDKFCQQKLLADVQVRFSGSEHLTVYQSSQCGG